MSEPCWERCDMCDDFICNIHGMHAYDCTCRNINWWVGLDMCPYTTTVDEYNERIKGVCNVEEQYCEECGRDMPSDLDGGMCWDCQEQEQREHDEDMDAMWQSIER